MDATLGQSKSRTLSRLWSFPAVLFNRFAWLMWSSSSIPSPSSAKRRSTTSFSLVSCSCDLNCNWIEWCGQIEVLYEHESNILLNVSVVMSSRQEPTIYSSASTVLTSSSVQRADRLPLNDS